MRNTALHADHIALGAKMGEFAGYEMPLYYALGVMKEHEWVREKAGLFDVSHMGQISLKGKGTQDFLQKLTPSSFEKLGINRTKYTVLMNETGGIVDDLMVTKTGEDEFHMVINAGCKEKDITWIKSRIPEAVELTYYEDWALLALQGPKSEKVIRDILGIDLSDLPYMALWFKDYTMFISRVGYTGEDGFEISIKNTEASGLWQKLLSHEDVKPIGLAARDSLRLEMGYCLYSHDITDETTPLEADLGWVMAKANTGYIGAAHVKTPLRKRVGIKLLEKGVAREGAEIRNLQDEKIGELSSGGYSPTLQISVGQGYVPIAYAEIGIKLFVNVRARNIPAEVAAMPFLAARTKSSKKKDAA